MTGSADNSFTKSVQSAITSISFPQTLERLRAMGLKWLKAIGSDWVTDMGVLLDFPTGKNVVWIAPKWLTVGDLLFFYHTKTVKMLVRKLYKEAKSLMQYSNPQNLRFTPKEKEMLTGILERSVTIAQTYSGTIFGFAVVSGRPQRYFDENKHFKGTIYAPLGDVFILKEPLPAKDFSDILGIGQNTTTPVYGEQFALLKERLGENNILPSILKQAQATSKGFRDVNPNNWIQISCHKDTRFVNEAQLRTYFLDYFLNEIKDTRSPVYMECDCFRNGQKTGIADYFIRLGDEWLPVEAKLSVIVENDILLQVAKYTHIDSFIPTKGSSAGKKIDIPISSCCLIVDQAGIYLVSDGNFVNCLPTNAMFKREQIDHAAMPRIRQRLINLIEKG